MVDELRRVKVGLDIWGETVKRVESGGDWAAEELPFAGGAVRVADVYNSGLGSFVPCYPIAEKPAGRIPPRVDDFKAFMDGEHFKNTIGYLNAHNIDYSGEGGGKEWTDKDIHSYYLANMGTIEP